MDFPHDALEALSVCGTASAKAGRKIGERVVMAQRVNQRLHNNVEACEIYCDASLKAARLIDVQNRKANYSEGSEYLCLSYVWGQVRQESRLLGALPALLPEVIKDAVTIVLRQYLSMDSVIFIILRQFLDSS